MKRMGLPVTDLTERRGAAAGVGIELGEDHAVEFELLVERLGGVHRVLAGHGVDDQEDLVGHDRGVDPAEFAHEFIVEVESAGGVEDHHVDAGGFGVLDRVAADIDRGADGLAVLGDLVRLAVELHAASPIITFRLRLDLLGQHAELGHRRRTLQVRGDQHHRLALFLEVGRQLAAGRGLAAALEARHHEDGRPGLDKHDRRRRLDLTGFGVHRRFAAQQLDQLVVDDLDHLLAGLHGIEHLRAHRLLEDPATKRLGHFVMHIRLEQGLADLFHRFTDIGFRNLAAAAERTQRVFKFIRQVVEHDDPFCCPLHHAAMRQIMDQALTGANRSLAQPPKAGHQ